MHMWSPINGYNISSHSYMHMWNPILSFADVNFTGAPTITTMETEQASSLQLWIVTGVFVALLLSILLVNILCCVAIQMRKRGQSSTKKEEINNTPSLTYDYIEREASMEYGSSPPSTERRFNIQTNISYKSVSSVMPPHENHT